MNLNLVFSKVMDLNLKIKKWLDPTLHRPPFSSPTRTLTHSMFFMTSLHYAVYDAI